MNPVPVPDRPHADAPTSRDGAPQVGPANSVDPFYDRGYHGTHHRDLIGEDEYYRARAETALTYWSNEERDLRIFDYGCGVGQSIALLPNAEGWDVSSEAREFCRAKGLRIHDVIADVPSGAYDRVLCRHVLEHVENPLGALREIRRLLRPDGELVMVLPVEYHWMPRNPEPDINQHLFCWTPRTIYNLLWRAGYSPKSLRYAFPFGQHRLVPLRRLLGSTVYHAAVKLGTKLLRNNGEMVIRALPISEHAA